MSECIGSDYDGISEVSYNALKKIANEKKVRIERIEFSADPLMTTTIFFDDNTHYEATGFSIGYGGTGPHFLHKAIQLFNREDIAEDFWRSGINEAEHSDRHRYIWTPDNGFRVKR